MSHWFEIWPIINAVFYIEIMCLTSHSCYAVSDPVVTCWTWIWLDIYHMWTHGTSDDHMSDWHMGEVRSLWWSYIMSLRIWTITNTVPYTDSVSTMMSHSCNAISDSAVIFCSWSLMDMWGGMGPVMIICLIDIWGGMGPVVIICLIDIWRSMGPVMIIYLIYIWGGTRPVMIICLIDIWGGMGPVMIICVIDIWGGMGPVMIMSNWHMGRYGTRDDMSDWHMGRYETLDWIAFV